MQTRSIVESNNIHPVLRSSCTGNLMNILSRLHNQRIANKAGIITFLQRYKTGLICKGDLIELQLTIIK